MVANRFDREKELVGDFAILQTVDQQRQDLKLAQREIRGIGTSAGSGPTGNAARADPAQPLGGNRLRRSGSQPGKDRQRRTKRHFVAVQQSQRRVIRAAERLPGGGSSRPIAGQLQAMRLRQRG